MEMSVEHRLVGGFAIGVEEVDPVAVKAAGSQCLRHSLGDVEHVSTGSSVDVGESRHMCSRDHEGVPGRDRVDIEKDDHGVILIDDGGVSIASDDLAEDAGWVVHRVRSDPPMRGLKWTCRWQKSAEMGQSSPLRVASSSSISLILVVSVAKPLASRLRTESFTHAAAPGP